MGNNDFSLNYKKVRRANSAIIKCRAKVWFLKACLTMNVRPVTPRPNVRDPAAHHPGYSAERAEAWLRAQQAAGDRLVQEVLDREKLRLVQLLEKGNEEWNAARRRVEEDHCTMRFQKKRAKNVQLWTLVSPRIFIEKSWNFAQSCLNSSRIWGLFFWKKNQEKNVEKIKKPVGGVCSSKDWSQKNPLAKRFFF